MRALGFAIAAAIVLITVPRAAGAQAVTDTEVVFAAVDGIRFTLNAMHVAGVVQGESAAREVAFTSSITPNSLGVEAFRSCEKYALVVMARPGQYRLTVRPSSGYPYLPYCGISRVNP